MKSVFDAQAGQSLVKLLQSSVGDLGASQIEARKAGNALKVPKPESVT